MWPEDSKYYNTEQTIMLVRYLEETNIDFIKGGIYEVVGECYLFEEKYYRIIDESGDDYVYSLDGFEILKD